MKRLQQTGRLSQPGRMRASPANIYATAMIKKACARLTSWAPRTFAAHIFSLGLLRRSVLSPDQHCHEFLRDNLGVIPYTVSVQNRVRPLRPARVKNEGSVDTRCQRGPPFTLFLGKPSHSQ